MDEFFIRPAVDGARLPDPVTGDPLAVEGETKPRNAYWLKCVNRGDVIEGDAPAAVDSKGLASSKAASAKSDPISAPVAS